MPFQFGFGHNMLSIQKLSVFFFFFFLKASDKLSPKLSISEDFFSSECIFFLHNVSL